MLILELPLKELLREATLYIDPLIVSMLLSDLRNNTRKPCGGEEIRDEAGIGLEPVWQPGDDCLLQGNDLVGIEEADHLVVDDVLIEGQLHILFELVVIIELYLDNLEVLFEIALSKVVKFVDEGAIDVVTLDLQGLGQASIKGQHVHD